MQPPGANHPWLQCNQRELIHPSCHIVYRAFPFLSSTRYLWSMLGKSLLVLNVPLYRTGHRPTMRCLYLLSNVAQFPIMRPRPGTEAQSNQPLGASGGSQSVVWRIIGIAFLYLG